MWVTFKAFNLTCLHLLHADMVYITLWYIQVPVRAGTGKSEQTRAEVRAHTRAHSYSFM